MFTLVPQPGSAWRPLSEFAYGPNKKGKLNKDLVQVPESIPKGEPARMSIKNGLCNDGKLCILYVF